MALNPHATRCEPYTDGPWCFAYDADNLDRLNELGAYEALLGFASGLDAEHRLEEVTEFGLAIAWKLMGDLATVDVLVGKKLTSRQKAKAQWLEPQRSFLSAPSGRLRIESLNSLSFGPDEPTDSGCEIEIEAGDYDVVLHRVNWLLMDDDREARPELPTEVLALDPVKKKGPKRKAAVLLLSEALGEDGAWLVGGRVEAGAFLGTTRVHAWEKGVTHVNLRGSHAELMGLRCGHSVQVTAGGAAISAPHIGYLSPRGLSTFFGERWHADHFPDPEAPLAHFSPFQGSTPWLLKLEHSELPDDAEVHVEVTEPWCEIPEAYRGDHEITQGKVVGRVVHVGPNSIILNVGWKELHAAEVQYSDSLELTCDGQRRDVYLEASSKDVLDAEREALMAGKRPDRVEIRAALEKAWSAVSRAVAKAAEAEYEGKDPSKWSEKAEAAEDEARRIRSELDAAIPSPDELHPMPLFARSMTYWDDPEQQLLWFQAFVGDRHLFDSPPGSRIELAVQDPPPRMV